MGLSAVHCVLSTYVPPSNWGPVFSYILIRREQLYTNIPSRSLCSMFTPNIKFSSFGSFKALKTEGSGKIEVIHFEQNTAKHFKH